jgi:uncharacterized membrane protein YbhN (UPF0104 family)
VTLSAADPARAARLRRWLQGLLWIGLTIALIIAIPRLPWRQALEHARRAQGGWVLAAVAANFAILPLWTAEWRLLASGAARVAYARMFEVVAVTAAVLNSVPFFAGELSGVALLIGRAGLARGAALSVLALDQLLVGFAKIAVIAAAALAAPLPVWLRAGVLSLVAATAALFGALLLLAHRRRLDWGRHLDALREPSLAWRVALLALAKKGVELAAILALQAAFGLDVSVGSALLVVAALSITTLVPVAPGNLGVYEATVFAVYTYLGVADAAALGLAIVQHVAFLVPPLATGYLMLTARQLAPREARAR